MPRTIALLFVLSLPSVANAARLTVEVRDGRGNGVGDAVVYAMPEGRGLPLAKKTAIMDQKNRMFVPHVLPIQTGTAVRFPNSAEAGTSSASRTKKKGHAQLDSVGAGKYAVQVWYPEMSSPPAPVSLTLGAADEKQLVIAVRK